MFNNSIPSIPTQQRPLETYNAYQIRQSQNKMKDDFEAKALKRRQESYVADANKNLDALIINKIDKVTTSVASTEQCASSSTSAVVTTEDILTPPSKLSDIIRDKQGDDIENIFYKYLYDVNIQKKLIYALMVKDLPQHYQKLSFQDESCSAFRLLGMICKYVEPRDGVRFNNLIAKLYACQDNQIKYWAVSGDKDMSYFLTKYIRVAMSEFNDIPFEYYMSGVMYNYPDIKERPKQYADIVSRAVVEFFVRNDTYHIENFAVPPNSNATSLMFALMRYIDHIPKKYLGTTLEERSRRFYPNVESDPRKERPELSLPIKPDPSKISFYNESELAMAIASAKCRIAADVFCCTVS